MDVLFRCFKIIGRRISVRVQNGSSLIDAGTLMVDGLGRQLHGSQRDDDRRTPGRNGTLDLTNTYEVLDRLPIIHDDR